MANVVSLDAAKWQLRLLDTSEDGQVTDLITAAQDWVERYTGLILSEREVTEPFDGFSSLNLRLRAWPIAPDAAVTISYRDASGVVQQQAGYLLAASRRPASVAPTIGAAWPAAAIGAGTVLVTFTAGYADADAVPAAAKRAILTLVAGWYDDRDGGEVATAAETAAARILDRAQLRLRTC